MSCRMLCGALFAFEIARRRFCGLRSVSEIFMTDRTAFFRKKVAIGSKMWYNTIKVSFFGY